MELCLIVILFLWCTKNILKYVTDMVYLRRSWKFYSNLAKSKVNPSRSWRSNKYNFFLIMIKDVLNRCYLIHNIFKILGTYMLKILSQNAQGYKITQNLILDKIGTYVWQKSIDMACKQTVASCQGSPKPPFW